MKWDNFEITSHSETFREECKLLIDASYILYLKAHKITNTCFLLALISLEIP